jgi:hypothetical protein
MTPTSGSGLSQTFTFVFSDPGGYRDLVWEQVLISGYPASLGSCHVFYSGYTNQWFLGADDGTGGVGPVAGGSSGTLQNGQCALNVASSSAVSSGNTLTLNVALTFQYSFPGTKSIWAAAASFDGLYSGWQLMGGWTVSMPVPAVVSLNPASGSGLSQTFTFVFSDPGGYRDLMWEQVLIAGNAASPGSCHVFYSAYTNQWFLGADDGTGGMGLPGGSSCPGAAAARCRTASVR